MRPKKVVLALFLNALSFQPATASPVVDYKVVPMPKEIIAMVKKDFTLTAATPIVYPEGNADIKRNTEFLAQYICEVTGTQVSTTTSKSKNAITLSLNKKMKEGEGHVITMTNKGISVAGKTPNGIFYDVQTLRKSLPTQKTENQITFSGVVIKDVPRPGYRGGVLDCSRHFFPFDFVKKYIDLSVLHNMNVFRQHLSEDQGWRIEAKKYPKLIEVESVCSETVIGRSSAVYDGMPYDGFYIQDQARGIVKYAADRYITVIPEADMLGYMLAALASYPELRCTSGLYKVSTSWGIFDDVLCLGNEKIYQFCQNVLGELIDIFPSKLTSIGGDESPRVRWEKCSKCQKVMKDHNLPVKKLQGYFINRIEKFVNSKGRSIIGQDEILDGDVNQSATVMSRYGIVPGIKAAKRGHDVAMSPTTYAYFDYYQTDKRASEPLLTGGNLPIEKTYSFDPLPDTLPVDVRNHIISVQANLWTEYIAYPNLVGYQLPPRLAAISEIQWSNKKKGFPEFKERLTRFVRFYDLYDYVYVKRLRKK